MTNGERRAAVLPVSRSLCWATKEEADRLGVAGQGTRHWAYRWVEEHVKHLAPVGAVADIGGGGLESALCNALSPHAQRVLVLDQFGDHRSKGNIQEVVVNLEDGLTEFPDASVDVFVSTSSIEHLTPDAQKRVFAEMERVLVPGGVFCGTISYITRLTDETMALLKREPAFDRTGSSVHGPFDARACLDAAPRLRPVFPPASWARFPGYDGFEEETLLGDETLVTDFVGSYGTVRLLPEIDALRLAWFEMGLFLRKDS